MRNLVFKHSPHSRRTERRGIAPVSPITIVGERNDEILAVLDEIPPQIDVSVERIGTYIQNPLTLTELLTERQREILDVALECGYYEVPREAPHRDIATKFGISPPTVSEHLQKIEAGIFEATETHAALPCSTR